MHRLRCRFLRHLPAGPRAGPGHRLFRAEGPQLRRQHHGLFLHFRRDLVWPPLRRDHLRPLRRPYRPPPHHDGQHRRLRHADLPDRLPARLQQPGRLGAGAADRAAVRRWRVHGRRIHLEQHAGARDGAERPPRLRRRRAARRLPDRLRAGFRRYQLHVRGDDKAAILQLGLARDLHLRRPHGLRLPALLPHGAGITDVAGIGKKRGAAEGSLLRRPSAQSRPGLRDDARLLVRVADCRPSCPAS